MGFWDSVLNVLSAPAKLFTGSGPLAKAAKSVFGSETGSLTPALNDVAKAASVVDAQGNLTASSLANGLLKAPAAIGNFAEKEAIPALNYTEKALGDMKSKVEKIPFIGKEISAELSAAEAPLKELGSLVGGAQEAIRAAEPAVSTAQAAVSAAGAAGSALKAKDIGGAIEKASKAIEIGQMAGRQAGQIPRQLMPKYGGVQQFQRPRANPVQIGAPNLR